LYARQSTLGITLLIVVVLAMAWANSPWWESYYSLWETEISFGFGNMTISEPLLRWINDGLMAYFFFLIGLEIKREVIGGSVQGQQRSALCLVAALAGMLVPAAIYLAINWGGEGMSGWGIPMVTDIAFAVGLLTLAGSQIQESSGILLKAIATIDDIGAILIIAFFLSADIEAGRLAVAGGYLAIMVAGNLLGIRSFWFYLIVGGLGLWVALLLSGIHATLAGFLTALTIPANTQLTDRAYRENMRGYIRAFGKTHSATGPMLSKEQANLIQEIIYDSKKALPPLVRVEENIRPFVHYGVLPLFALANAGVRLEGNFWEMFTHPVSLGVIAGLFLGKVGGIFLFCRVLRATGLGKLPPGTTMKEIGGVGLMAGIGFTMSIFIAELALEDPYLIGVAKIGVLVGSALSAIFGILWFRSIGRPANPAEEATGTTNQKK
jgi:NhaA family Na+:H+ antiporter